MVIILVEMVINLAEVIIIIVEIIINFVEVVRRVAERISVIIGMVAGMATVKSRTRGAAGSVGSIDGVVVVATADYTLLIYISGRVSSVGRSINTMARRSSRVGGRGCVMGRRINIMLGSVSMEGGTGSLEGGRGSMEGGRVSMEGANAQTTVRRDSSAVGSVRTKAIKKGSTEALPLNVLLI